MHNRPLSERLIGSSPYQTFTGLSSTAAISPSIRLVPAANLSDDTVNIGPDQNIKTLRSIFLSNNDLYQIYLGHQSGFFQHEKEDNESLLLKPTGTEESVLKKELIVVKYTKFFIDYYSVEEIEEIIKKSVHKQLIITLFYKKISEAIKTSGYAITDYDQKVRNYHSYQEIEDDLLYKNAEDYGQRIVTSLTTILSLSVLYNVVSSTIEITRDSSPNKYAQMLPQAVFVLLAVFLTLCREFYRKRSIKQLSRKIQAMLETSEYQDFDLAELKLAMQHAVAIKIAGETAITVLKEEAPEEVQSSKSLSINK